MENNRHSSMRKTQNIEIPTASMISSESEIGEENTPPHTKPSRKNTDLLEIVSKPDLSEQDLLCDNLLLAEDETTTENCLEQPQVQKSKSLVPFSESHLEKAGRKSPGVSEKPFKISKLLQDRILVLENEVQKHLTEVNEVIQQSETERTRERAVSFSSSNLGIIKSFQSGKSGRLSANGAGLSTRRLSLQKDQETAMKPRHPGNRLPKIRSKSLTSCDTSSNFTGKKFRPRRKIIGAVNNSNQDHRGIVNMAFIDKIDDKQEADEIKTETKVISMLEMTEEVARNPQSEKASPTPERSILKEGKTSASKQNKLTKTVNKTIQQLYKLNKDKEAENLSDLLESKLMAEKELKKAIKKEQQEEKEERNRLETKTLEKSRREAFFLRMEELGRMEEEMRETRMRERERRRAEARERRQKNIALWDERQKINLSAKISRAFKFSYFPLLIRDSRSSTDEDDEDDEQSSSEDSGSSTSDNRDSFSGSRQSPTNKGLGASSTHNRKRSQVIGCEHSRRIRK
ncbi:hypothetical protein ABFA07_000210 [Porites harrisoni]